MDSCSKTENKAIMYISCTADAGSDEARIVCYFEIAEMNDNEKKFFDKFIRKCIEYDILYNWDYLYENDFLEKWELQMQPYFFNHYNYVEFIHDPPHKVDFNEIRELNLHPDIVDKLEFSDFDEFQIHIEKELCIMKALTIFINYIKSESSDSE